MRTDPRTHPHLVKALAEFDFDIAPPPPPVNVNSPLQEILDYFAEVETGFEAINAAWYSDLPPIQDVERHTETIKGVDGNDIRLYIHRPKDAAGLLPCVYHIHGGGMVIMKASNAGSTRWRDELASLCMVVVGVEFRNGAGVLGCHPFPAGLNDCQSGLEWTCENKTAMGISRIIVSGESGGGNLALALCLKSKKDGKLEQIDGVYAMCPFISNAWGDKTKELSSLYENDEYTFSCRFLALIPPVYDPGNRNATNPLCWPYFANNEDLQGLPPHVISVNELDPLRDEGLRYYRVLMAAGVGGYSQTVNGTNHNADQLRKALPDVFAATIRDLKGFADSLQLGAAMRHYVYVPITDERRFLVFALEPESGKLALRHEIELAAQPWQLCIDPTQRYLYQQVRDEGYSGVVSFRIDPQSGGVTQVGEVELEEAACYVSTDRTGRFLFADYLIPGMVTVHPFDADGAVYGPAVERRVTEIYAHSILTDPSNRQVFVPHVKPTDVIYQFLFDEKTGKLTPNKVPKIVTDPGHGPRHYAFHPTLNVVYFNEEQVSRVAVYRLDSESGTLDKLQSISTLPEEGFAGDNSTASVRVHPSGKAVYVPNRGHDSIAVFAADSATGLLSSLGHVDSEAIPRPVGIAPDGDLFFAGSDTTGRLSTYRINAQYMLEPLDVYDLGMWVAWILPVKFT